MNSRPFVILGIAGAVLPLLAAPSGSVTGRIVDGQGTPLQGAVVRLENPVSGHRQEAGTDAEGRYSLYNVPTGEYQVEVAAKGFQVFHGTVSVPSSLPVAFNATLQLPGATVVVEADAGLVEPRTSSHQDIDRSTIEKVPEVVQSRGLENILLTTPGFIQDENGRFHFRGSHGQVMYVIDGVPVTDQVQATFSNSLDPAQVDSMAVITGGIPAEFGGKPVAVVNLSSKSGLGTPDGFKGEVSAGVARFETYEGGAQVQGCTDTFGYFVALAGSQSDRFLDPVNFDNLHNHGTTSRIFTRFDWILSDQDTLRFSVSGGKTGRDVVNLASQEAAGMNQRVTDGDSNLNLGWTHLLSATQSLDATLFYRHSTADLDPTASLQPGYPAGGPDTPVVAQQTRSLDNQGALLAFTQKEGGHTFKTGLQYVRYPVHEQFAFAITNPGNAQITPIPPGLLPYTPASTGGGGQIFNFNEGITPSLASAFVQDDLATGNWNFGLGLRLDSYHGRNYVKNQFQPRLGATYTIPSSRTLFRAAYDRLLITPENENLAFSTSQAVWNLVAPAGTQVPNLLPEIQDSCLVGMEQQVGKYVRVSLEYWWKDSTNSADNDQFFNTGLLFPIAAAKGKFHGTDLRLDVTPIHGWSGYLSAGTVRTLFYSPTIGGLTSADPTINGPAGTPYLIDHDEKLCMQWSVRYEHEGFFTQVIGRYDSGLEAGDPTTVAGNPDYAFGIPYVRAENDSLVGLNYRIEPRTVWNLNMGQEFKLTEKRSLLVDAALLNVFDKQGLYNFLSTFGGTHVIPPRTLAVHVKYRF